MIREISLKGVGRKYRNQGSTFSVIDDIFKKNHLDGSNSLREKLEDLAEDNHTRYKHECVFHWKASYEQTWAHVEMRIELDPDKDVSDATIAALKPVWESGIQDTWNNLWAVGHSGELSCDITFDVRWVTSDRHHKVKVHGDDPQQTDMGNWNTTNTGDDVAHEFGHMLGNPDEYTTPECPNRSPVDTGTIMDVVGGPIPSRLVQVLADNLDSSIVAA